MGLPVVVCAASLLLGLQGALGQTEAAGPEPPRRVALASAAGHAGLPEALTSADQVFIPAGVHYLDDSLVLADREDVVIIGAGRLDSGARLEFRGDHGLRLRNCRRVLLCNLWISAPQCTAAGAALEVTGETPCDLQLLNCMLTGGTITGPAQGSGGPALRVAGPARVQVQGCHFYCSDPGLLLAHPEAEVTVLGGNFQNDTVHIRQEAGRLQALGIGFQLAHGGADVELRAATARPCAIAACRTEGPQYLLRTPDTDAPINAVVQACSIPGDIRFVRYGAAGTLVLIGNNAPAGIEAANGTVWSLANRLGGVWREQEPHEIGPQARAFAVADTWGLVRPDEPYQEPGNAIVTADELRTRGRPVPANVQFLEAGAELPELGPPEELPLAAMPIIENIGELLPSVRDYGATGDGVTDDTEALERALAAHRNAALYVPPGRYRVRHPLFLDHRNGGWLVGAGPERTVIANVDGEEDGVIRTDGCGYSAFQDLAFVAREGGDRPAFDLSWNQQNPAPPDFLGAALQANVFYRCRFEGGAVGLSIGREGYMGSESLIVDGEFVGCGIGLAVCNFNALSNNAVRCVFRNNGVAVSQEYAGSFNVLASRFEGSREVDVRLRNSAGDAFWISDTTSTSARVLETGHTGAVINVLLDGLRYLGDQPVELTSYVAGGSLVLLDSDLGPGSVGAGGTIATKTVVLARTVSKAQDPLRLSGRAQGFLLGGGVEPGRPQTR